MIRAVRETDAASLAELLHSLDQFPHIQSEPLETTRTRVLGMIRQCLADESHSMFLAHDKTGALAGYLSIHWLPYLILKAPEGYVSELFVNPEARSKGIGKQLLEVALREAARRGCSRLSLLNFRNRESYQRQFYAKNGWTERVDAANFVLPVPEASAPGSQT
jgi:GNAT superfamily N-acetyltransferase